MPETGHESRQGEGEKELGDRERERKYLYEERLKGRCTSFVRSARGRETSAARLKRTSENRMSNEALRNAKMGSLAPRLR